MKNYLDNKKIILSSMIFLFALIFLSINFKLWFGIILFIFSLFSIYLLIFKSDYATAILFFIIFFLNVLSFIINNQIILILAITILIFILNYFLIYQKENNIEKIVYSLTNALIVMQVIIISIQLTDYILAISLIISATNLFVSQVLLQKNKIWNLHSYVYCIIFIIVAIPIVIFYY